MDLMIVRHAIVSLNTPSQQRSLPYISGGNVRLARMCNNCKCLVRSKIADHADNVSISSITNSLQDQSVNAHER